MPVNYYPINLNLKDKECLVIGAGRVAERKVRRLLECGAQVSVIAPLVTPRLKTLAGKKKITWGKLNPGSYMIQICGDYTEYFPDIAALILHQ